MPCRSVEHARACWAFSLRRELLAGCASGGGAPAAGPVAGARPLGPFYGVPQDMLRPDGTMINGLLPINPDDQS